LSELVKIRSTTGAEMEIAHHIAAKMEKWGFETVVVPEPFPERPQVVVYCGRNVDGRTLVLNGHMDTVPEGKASDWSVDPYGGLIKDGRVYGRGSVDMKGGLVTMMFVPRILEEACVDIAGRLVLTFVVGEEKAEPGTKALVTDYLPRKGVRANWGLVLEPTEMNVATAERGMVWAYITVGGKSAHASVPELGINPISKAVKAVEALDRYAAALRRRTHRLVGSAVSTVTMIQGGTAENVIPNDCKLTVDRRFIPGESLEQVERELNDVLSEITREDPEFSFSVKRGGVTEPSEIPADSHFVQVLMRNTAEVMKRRPQVVGMLGGTDARNFNNDAGVPCAIWGPGDMRVAHTVDEYIGVSHVISACKVLALTTMDLVA
jgi:succinyl-diaminopimelate desuccinylase